MDMRWKLPAAAWLPVLLLATAGRADESDPERFERMTIKGQTFRLEIAATEETRTRGLMWRETLASDEGMLFVFPREEKMTFWMANTLIPLDIVFMDATGRITAMHTMLPEKSQGALEPDHRYQARLTRYSSREPAQFAIEFPAGTIEWLQLRTGDILPLKTKRLSRITEN